MSNCCYSKCLQTEWSVALGLITTLFKEENVRLSTPETAAPQKPLPQATTDLPSTVSVLDVTLNKHVRDYRPNQNPCGTLPKEAW